MFVDGFDGFYLYLRISIRGWLPLLRVCAWMNEGGGFRNGSPRRKDIYIQSRREAPKVLISRHPSTAHQHPLPPATIQPK
jgi:hypothetical protein